METALVLLSAYYLTYALTRTDGPWGAFYRMRAKTWLPFHCVACTSLWTALAALALWAWCLPALYALALAGAVTLVFDLIDAIEA